MYRGRAKLRPLRRQVWELKGELSPESGGGCRLERYSRAAHKTRVVFAVPSSTAVSTRVDPATE